MKYNLIQIVILSSFLGLFANNLNSQNTKYRLQYSPRIIQHSQDSSFWWW